MAPIPVAKGGDNGPVIHPAKITDNYLLIDTLKMLCSVTLRLTGDDDEYPSNSRQAAKLLDPGHNRRDRCFRGPGFPPGLETLEPAIHPEVAE